MDFATKLIITTVVFFVFLGIADTASPKDPSSGNRSSNEMQSEEDLELEKLDAEINKLRAEVRSLDAVGPKTRFLSTMFGAMGGVIGAIIGVLVALTGRKLNEHYKRTQDKKLNQDYQLSRESHNIALFRNLGDENVRGQLAAAAMLLQRLGDLEQLLHCSEEGKKHVTAPSCNGTTALPAWYHYKEREKERERRDKERERRDKERERRAIAQGLIAVLKEHIAEEKTDPKPDGNDEEGSSDKPERKPARPSTHPALVKFIADKIVVEMGARPKGRDTEEKQPPPRKSPLEEFDFQNVTLTDADWKKVDARHVDFFKADLRKASLKKANLSGAIFYQAVLRETKLIEAVLCEANLYEVDLRGADLRGADLRGADLENAKYDNKTSFLGAIYDDTTKKPDSRFSFEKVGAVFQIEEKKITQT